MSNDHDQALARAFDVQAPRFERAPVQSDPAALERLVRFAGFPPGSRILDAGCGPGLVCEALLSAGYRVVGVDLSREMIERARGDASRGAIEPSFINCPSSTPPWTTWPPSTAPCPATSSTT